MCLRGDRVVVGGKIEGTMVRNVVGNIDEKLTEKLDENTGEIQCKVGRKTRWKADEKFVGKSGGVLEERLEEKRGLKLKENLEEKLVGRLDAQWSTLRFTWPTLG